jgi:hypothetical protein
MITIRLSGPTLRRRHRADHPRRARGVARSQLGSRERSTTAEGSQQLVRRRQGSFLGTVSAEADPPTFVQPESTQPWRVGPNGGQTRGRQ